MAEVVGALAFDVDSPTDFDSLMVWGIANLTGPIVFELSATLASNPDQFENNFVLGDFIRFAPVIDLLQDARTSNLFRNLTYLARGAGLQFDAILDPLSGRFDLQRVIVSSPVPGPAAGMLVLVALGMVSLRSRATRIRSTSGV